MAEVDSDQGSPPAHAECIASTGASRRSTMLELKFIDGTPVPDDYLTSASRLVRDAALAIDVFGEDELEAASRAGASQNASEAVERKRCCVCGEEIFDEEESGF